MVTRGFGSFGFGGFRMFLLGVVWGLGFRV